MLRNLMRTGVIGDRLLFVLRSRRRRCRSVILGCSRLSTTAAVSITLGIFSGLGLEETSETWNAEWVKRVWNLNARAREMSMRVWCNYKSKQIFVQHFWSGRFGITDIADNVVHPVIVFLACAHGLGPGLGMDDLTWTLDHSNYEDNSEYFLLAKLLFLCIADINKLRSHGA